MGKAIEIILDQSESCFAPGSVVRGTLVVELEEAKSYEKITVLLEGKGKVSWQEGSGNNRVTYYSSERYVDLKTVLWESSQSPDETLERGRYTYPFEFVLPENCPSSFRSHVGRIYYKIKGLISTGQFKFDIKVNQYFDVVKCVSIDQSLTQKDINVEKKKQVGFSCCGCGVITFSAQLPCDGFSVGQEIPVQVNVENGSGRLIKIRARLIERITYITTRKRRTSENEIAVKLSESLRSHAFSYWTSSNFLVPQIRPAITSSKIIKSQYMVRVTVVIPWALNSSIDIPVTIGNVSHGQEETQFSTLNVFLRP